MRCRWVFPSGLWLTVISRNCSGFLVGKCITGKVATITFWAFELPSHICIVFPKFHWHSFMKKLSLGISTVSQTVERTDWRTTCCKVNNMIGLISSISESHAGFWSPPVKCHKRRNVMPLIGHDPFQTSSVPHKEMIMRLQGTDFYRVFSPWKGRRCTALDHLTVSDIITNWLPSRRIIILVMIKGALKEISP